MIDNFGKSSLSELQTSKWKKPITWSALIITGLLVYEFTTQPILGVIVICSKFGWNDFIMAYLLRRVDSNTTRARVVSWFCLASGLAKVVLASTFLAVGIYLTLGAPLGQAAFQAQLTRLISAFGTVFLGYLLITVTVFRGVTCAKKFHTKIWLTSYLPLTNPGIRRSENLLDFLLVFALLPLGLLGFEVFPTLGILLEPQGLLLIPFLSLWLFWCGLIFFLLWKVYVAVKKYFHAANPFECWECDSLGKVMIARMTSARRVSLLMQMSEGLAQSGI
jgi:hypothetical protein